MMEDRPDSLIAKARRVPEQQEAQRAAERATRHLFSLQREDGHWCAELESNAAITAEYVMLYTILAEVEDPSFGPRFAERREGLLRYFFSHQKEDGSWGIAYNYAGDVSTTTEVYFALRLLDLPVEDPRMRRAEAFILGAGGIEQVRIMTRIHLAMFGLFPWRSVPGLPPELMLMPTRLPLNIYSFSSWARGTIVPMMVLFHHRPIFTLPNGKSEQNGWLDHLWKDPADKNIPYRPPLQSMIRENGVSWRTFFALADSVTSIYERVRLEPIRNISVGRAVSWLKERIEESGDIAGIWPPMFYGTLALLLTDHAVHEHPLAKVLEAIERFTLDDEEGFRVQACVSPVWDTALSMIALLSNGADRRHEGLERARRWLAARQVRAEYGDWKIYNPAGPGGGWSFEYDNTWYPDVDDTAAVLIAVLRQQPGLHDDPDIRRAIRWMLSMQNPDGGWAAFDVRNNKVFLNEIPFSDMDSLLDPSSPDVTGRVLQALGQIGDPALDDHVARAIAYLRRHQEPEGSWFGRWGVNYVYGTSIALSGLCAHGVRAEDPMVTAALAWLARVQNEDGGFGECLESYRERSLMGRGPSTASQTAWGLTGLLAFLPAHHEAVRRAVRWLVSRQVDPGTWEEREFTGTGFPNHFYIRYHLYRHYFPLTALGRFLEACRSPA